MGQGNVKQISLGEGFGEVAVKVNGGIVGTAQESEQHEEDSSREEQTARWVVDGDQSVGDALARGRTKVPPQARETGKSGNHHKEAGEIGGDAGPTDRFERTVNKSDIMNQENAHGKEPRANQEGPGDSAFRARGERDPRFNQGQKQGEITEVDHVDVRVHFGAAILEEFPDALEIRLNSN